MLLSVDFNFKENLADRLKSPFPTSQAVLPPEASLAEHEAHTARFMHIGFPANQLQASRVVYSDSYQQDFRIPACYNMSKPKDLPESVIKGFPERVLFYIFYNMPNDKA